jgi:hypothetical protein
LWRERNVFFDRNQLEYYNPVHYSEKNRNKKFYNDKLSKKLNAILIFIGVGLLIQTVLIAEKLDGSLINKSWFVILLPFVLGFFFSCLFIILADTSFEFIMICTTVILFAYSIIFPIAAKLDGKITSRYVKKLIFLNFIFIF